MTRTMATFVIAATLIGSIASQSRADEPTYLVTSLDTLYRVTQDRGIESWQFPGVSMRGSYRDADNGAIYVLGDDYGYGQSTVYTVQNGAVGTPTLSTYAELDNRYSCLTKIDDYFYAFKNGLFYQIDLSDPQNPVEQLISDTGFTGSDGTAYDPATDTLYMASLQYDTLYEVDQNTGSATPVGDFGVDISGQGLEWYDNTLFVAAQNVESGFLELGTYSTTTGAYTEMLTIDATLYMRATSLAIIPEPSAIALLLIGVAAAFRR